MIEIIAECGKNFLDTIEEQPISVLLEKAKKLIDEAKKCGCSTVKFQCHDIEDEIHPNSHLISPHFSEDRYKWVKRNTYPSSFFWEIKEYCRKLNIDFLCTPMSRGAAELLHEIGVERWKIGSGDILDFVMLDYIRQTGHPVILSSGMSTIEELKLAYDYLTEGERVRDITILHCVSIYPCPPEHLNLATITYLKKQFPKAKIGFSDHSLSINSVLKAVELGVEVIEKHFTLDRDAFGPDHKVSLLPDEMKELVEGVRAGKKVELSPYVMGIETKAIDGEEMPYRPVFHKGLYASRDISKGEFIDSDMIYALRPRMDNALPSEKYPELLDKYTTKSYKKYEAITL